MKKKACLVFCNQNLYNEPKPLFTYETNTFVFKIKMLSHLKIILVYQTEDKLYKVILTYRM